MAQVMQVRTYTASEDFTYIICFTVCKWILIGMGIGMIFMAFMSGVVLCAPLIIGEVSMHDIQVFVFCMSLVGTVLGGLIAGSWAYQYLMPRPRRSLLDWVGRAGFGLIMGLVVGAGFSGVVIAILHYAGVSEFWQHLLFGYLFVTGMVCTFFAALFAPFSETE